jgi:hypothetical protein
MLSTTALVMGVLVLRVSVGGVGKRIVPERRWLPVVR